MNLKRLTLIQKVVEIFLFFRTFFPKVLEKNVFFPTHFGKELDFFFRVYILGKKCWIFFLHMIQVP